MKTLSEIKDFTDVLEFTDGYSTYVKDNRARASLNKTLETNYKAVYRHNDVYKRQWRQNDIDWDGEKFYVVTTSGKVLEFINSEWGGVGEFK